MGLLFEAAYHLEVRELRENAWAIGALAIPGVAVTALFREVAAPRILAI